MAKKIAQPTNSEWVIKDRLYMLKNGKSPLTYQIKSRGINWFDEEKGYERELKYTQNQKTPFVDEFKGVARLAHIVFEDGILHVPREKQVLQKLLSLYHPDKDKLYEEYDAEVEAQDDLEIIEAEVDALIIAREMEIDQAEAIMRVELGSKVSEMTSKELKRDLLIFARRNPRLFMDLAKDENVGVRNMGVKAAEQGIIKLSDDQRTFKWATNGRVLMTVPFDENPYSALAAWFKTDEGVEVYQAIEKKLK
jgi:hypothetical protein